VLAGGVSGSMRLESFPPWGIVTNDAAVA